MWHGPLFLFIINNESIVLKRIVLSRLVEPVIYLPFHLRVCICVSICIVSTLGFPERGCDTRPLLLLIAVFRAVQFCSPKSNIVRNVDKFSPKSYPIISSKKCHQKCWLTFLSCPQAIFSNAVCTQLIQCLEDYLPPILPQILKCYFEQFKKKKDLASQIKKKKRFSHWVGNPPIRLDLQVQYLKIASNWLPQFFCVHNAISLPFNINVQESKRLRWGQCI